MDEKEPKTKKPLPSFKEIATRVWEYIKAAKLELIVMVALFAIDLITKAIVEATMYEGQVIVVIPYFLNICYVKNPNAAFGASWLSDGIGEKGAQVLFSIFAILASLVFIFILVRNKGGHKMFRIALAMLTAGAMGNCIDRMVLNYVRDFVQLVYFGLTIAGSKSFFVFNIADAALVVGVILVIIYFIFIYKDKSDLKKTEATSVAPQGGDEGAAENADTEPEGSLDGAERDTAEASADRPDEEIEPLSAEPASKADLPEGKQPAIDLGAPPTEAPPVSYGTEGEA